MSKHLENHISDNIDNKTILNDIKKNTNDYRESIINISNLLCEMQKLCLTISEFTLKIDEKLSQYDIDDNQSVEIISEKKDNDKLEPEPDAENDPENDPDPGLEPEPENESYESDSNSDETNSSESNTGNSEELTDV